MSLWLILFASTVATVLLTGMLRRYALARSLVDIPNERSSHSLPTPRGGGAAIVLVFLVALPLSALVGEIQVSSQWALLGAGMWVATIGFLDDHGHIPARWRLLGHFGGAAWALAWLGGLPPLPAFGMVIDLGWVGHLLAAVYLVWLLNLYNFMDGIDGIAGIEAVTVCVGSAVLAALSPQGEGGGSAPLLLAAATLGFLFWNFPKARIFMGDAGSGFIGIVLGVMSIEAGWSSGELFWGWVILLGAFVVDATVTLLRRVLRRERFYEAHRSHAYQYASRRYRAHPPVSLVFGVINVLWLLPIAVLVATGWMDGVAGVIVAYSPLIWLAHRFKAGAPEMQEV